MSKECNHYKKALNTLNQYDAQQESSTNLNLTSGNSSWIGNLLDRVKKTFKSSMTEKQLNDLIKKEYGTKSEREQLAAKLHLLLEKNPGLEDIMGNFIMKAVLKLDRAAKIGWIQ